MIEDKIKTFKEFYKSDQEFIKDLDRFKEQYKPIIKEGLYNGCVLVEYKRID